MANTDHLTRAKKEKNDEFYTQYPTIEKEMTAYVEYNPNVFRDKTILLPCDDPEWSNFTKYFALHFEEYGMKKLISTSFAQESKNFKTDWQPTLFETENPLYNAEKSVRCGKIFTLDRDVDGDGKVDINDLRWTYLNGNGDFRSEEVTALRDEADIIITNPPFSLWREFFVWIMDAKKSFVIIGNSGAVSYKEAFLAIKENKIWLGATGYSSDMVFAVPPGAEVSPSDKAKAEKLGYKGNFTRLGNSCWFTNIDHGRRHQPLSLMSKADILRYTKHKELKGQNDFLHYDNYDAIEIPYTDSIPSDYEGIMGVPSTFLDKFCPEQFEILGKAGDIEWAESDDCNFFTPPPEEIRMAYKKMDNDWRVQHAYVITPSGKPHTFFSRIFIRRRNPKK